MLYYRGTLLDFDELPVVTVVGSRNASAYGLAVARKMGNQIGACGGVVVSGAAKGIDSQALEGALEAGAYVATDWISSIPSPPNPFIKRWSITAA